MMRFLATLCLLALLPGLMVADDKKEKVVEPIKVVTLDRKEPVTYDKDVEPILLNKCAFCHSGNIKEGKLDMGSYDTLVKGGKRGKVLVPGKSSESLLVLLCGKTQKPFMPPTREEPLNPEELALIKLWIDQGAKAPSGQRERPKVVVSLPPANVQPVNGISISPDKSSLAASRGNQIHIYDAGSGAYVRRLVDPNLTGPDKKPVQAAHLALVESCAYSPDGKFLASGSYQEVILWDAQTGLLKQRLTGFADRVVALAFSPDGKWLATGGGAPTEEGEIKVFEVPSGKLITDIKNGHSDTVFGVCFSPEFKVDQPRSCASAVGCIGSPLGQGPYLGISALFPRKPVRMLATCSADKFVKTWELPSGKFIKAFEGHTHHVLGVGWKADGKLLASGGADNVVKVWDFEKGEQARTIPAHGKQVTQLFFIGKSPQFVTCAGDAQVRFWNADNGGNTRNFGGNNDFLYAVGVSPDGSIVAAGGQEGVVRLYNGNNGTLIKSLLPPGVEPPAPKK